MLFLFEGPFFYFYCCVSSPISLHLKKQTFVWTVHWFLHTCLLHLLYFFALTTIHKIYMLQVESNRWNLIFHCVASMSLLWIYCFMSNSYARLIDACLESTIHEKSLLYDSLVYSLHLHCFESLHSSHMLYNGMIKIMLVACHFKNYLLSFTYSRTSRN